jgi:hypothetical protein
MEKIPKLRVRGDVRKMDEDLRCKYLQGQPYDLTVEKKFRLALKLLRENFPPEYPVKIRRRPTEIMKRGGYKDAPWGYCSLVNADTPKSDGRRYFLIELHKGASWNKMFDTLIHEWAHAITWQKESKDHGDLFARAYGNIYRFMVED